MAKRKTATKEKKSSNKRTKSEVSFLSAGELETLKSDILEQQKLNSIVPLVKEYEVLKKQGENADADTETALRLLTKTLFEIFQQLIKDGTTKPSEDEKKLLIAKWTREKYVAFQDEICYFIKSGPELSLQLDALDVMLGLLRAESQSLTRFAQKTYDRLVAAVLVSDSIGVIENFVAKYAKYWDLQLWFPDAVRHCLESGDSASAVYSNFVKIIENKLLFVADFDKLQEAKYWAYPPAQADYKKKFQTALLQVIGGADISATQYKELLLILHKRVIPLMLTPSRLMDFLTDAYDQEEDEIIPLLALNSLWELMKVSNLEYPAFYTKLYSLLTPNLMATRYRLRFFRLCDLFLTSTHISSALVASFIKKLARSALTAPAPAVVIIIPFIYNLLKRHPMCMALVHNTDVQKFNDTFDINESDPLKTGAIKSSLWELETIMSHYHPNIATLAKIFKEPFRKPSYNMEDFLDWTYLTLLESERTRKYRGEVAVEYEEWDAVFESEENEDSRAFVVGWVL